MTFEKDKKLSPLFADKVSGERIGNKFKKPLTGRMLDTGIVGMAGAMAAAMTTVFMGNPLMNPGMAFDSVFAEKPLTEEQASKLLAQVMDDKLDPRLYDDEQQGAARGHIRANIGDLSHLRQSFLTAASSRKKNAEEVASRIDAIMETQGFTQLMNEHSAVWRQQQRVMHGQEVASALSGGNPIQAKAPPRASFTRNRNTVTA